MRSVLVGLLAAILGLLAWWVLGSSPGAPAVDPSRDAVTGALVPSGTSGTRTVVAGSAAESFMGTAVEAGGARRGTGGRGARVEPLGLLEASAPAPASREEVAAPGREPMLFTGRVLAAGSSKGVEGARVLLRAGRDKNEARTDERGRFSLKWLRGLEGDLLIEHADFVDLGIAMLAPDELGKDPEFELTRSGVLKGHVTLPAGFSLEGASVDVWRMVSKGEKDWQPFEAEVGRGGAFALGDLEPGSYAACPRATGLSGRYVAGLSVTAGAETFVELECAQGGRLRGTLVGPPGFSMPSFEGTRVELVPRDVGMPKGLARERGFELVADADGSFELGGIAPGAHRLRVEPLWGGLRSFKIDFDGSGEELERSFELPAPARLEGLVKGPDGKPSAGATVVVARRKDQSAVAGALAGASAGAVACGADGRFAFETVAAGEELVLVARAEGAAPGWRAVEALAPGEARGGVVLELPGRLELGGRVEARSETGSVGAHIGGARVVARYSTNGREFTFASCETNADGEWQLVGLMPGAVRIEARADGFLASSASLELIDGVEPARLDLALARAEVLTGRVVDEDGAGVARLRVRASGLDPDLDKEARAALKGSLPPDRVVRTDTFGRFEFSDLAAGSWYLAPLGGDFELVESRPRVVDAGFTAAGGEVEVVVRRLKKSERAAVRFSVVRSDSGLVPSGLEVHGAGAGAVVIDGGEVMISAMTPKPTRLTLTADGCASRYLDVELSPGRREELGLVQLDPGARVTVAVKSSKGAEVKGAKVRLVPKAEELGGPRMGTPTMKLKHIGGGRYRLDGVPLAQWIVKVSAKGARTSRSELDVTAAKVKSTIKLSEAKARSAR